MTAEEHNKKMEEALTNIMDPAVKEYLRRLEMLHEADLRFMCDSLNTMRRHMSKRFSIIEERLEVLEGKQHPDVQKVLDLRRKDHEKNSPGIIASPKQEETGHGS